MKECLRNKKINKMNEKVQITLFIVINHFMLSLWLFDYLKINDKNLDGKMNERQKVLNYVLKVMYSQQKLFVYWYQSFKVFILTQDQQISNWSRGIPRGNKAVYWTYANKHFKISNIWVIFIFGGKKAKYAKGLQLWF